MTFKKKKKLARSATKTVTRECIKPHKDDLNDMYSSPNIILVTKLKKNEMAIHVSGIGRGEVHTEIW